MSCQHCDAPHNIDPIHAAINEGFGPDEQRDTFRTAPYLTERPFLPIRAGRLRFERLSVVDAFGQTVELPVERINDSAQNGWNKAMLRRAHSCLADSSQSAANSYHVWLKPRFAQPMRLRFEWANASPSAAERGGPVCGWIVPNYLEKSLMIYAANGVPLGALQKKLGIRSGYTGPAYHWVDVPAGKKGGDPRGRAVSERLAEIVEDAHLHYFCSWVLALNADDGAAFSAMLDQSMAAVDQRVPDEDPGVSVLVDRPLALVRASLQFEVASLPAHRPALHAAAGAASERGLDARLDTGGFQQVEWPVRLGDIDARNDGLIGAFRCTPAASGDDVFTDGAFYPAWGQDKRGDGAGSAAKARAFAVQDFAIDCVQPLQVTMLMDPQARVHATTGALPRTFVELPHERATGARRAREVFFQTAPVLGTMPTPHMPKPSDDYGERSWAYRPDVTPLWRLDPNIVEATDRGGFAKGWPTIAEGWLKLAIAPVKVLSFWVREGENEVDAGTRIHLAWSLQGAESVKLEGDGMDPIEWTAAPFPREVGVTVQIETTYRITAYAEDADPSVKELTIKIKAAQ